MAWVRYVLVGFILALVLPASSPKPVAALPDIQVAPATVELTLQHGEARTLAIALTNPSQQAIQPLVYEAMPAVAQPARATAPPLRASLPQQSERLDQRIASLPVTQTLDFTLYLSDQADLSAATRMRDWAERGRYVYTTLVAHAERTQQPIRALLASRGLAYQPLWIVNAVRVRGTPADAAALASQPALALIRAEHTMTLPAPAPAQAIDGCSPDAPTNPICWNIRAIGADRVWREFGVQGQGVVVAVNDSGALAEHPALAAQYRGNQGAGQIRHAYSWFDPEHSATAPTDASGHGTHVLGTLVGAGTSLSQPAIGVAPAARWIATQGCHNDFCSESDLIAAAQWLVAPTDQQGLNPRPDLRPMVVNNSWGTLGGNLFYQGYIAVWQAAGIIPVFAAGNAGSEQAPVCGSIGSPADDPNAIAVGALDAHNQLAWFSLRGPTSDGRIKPDLTAPGVGIVSAYASASQPYMRLQGTSMAAPHVAGTIALLLSANPDLIGDYAAVYRILTESASPIQTSSCGSNAGIPNQLYGYGMLNAYAAVAQARIDLPWLAAAALPRMEPGAHTNLQLTIDTRLLPGPGVYRARVQLYRNDLSEPPVTIPITLTVAAQRTVAVTGQLTDQERGHGIAGQVGIAGGMAIATDQSGFYTLMLAPGFYTLEATAQGYFGLRTSVAVSSSPVRWDAALLPDQPRLEVINMTPVVSVTVGMTASVGLVLKNTGTRPLVYQLVEASDKWAVWRSDEPGGPSAGLLDLPASASTLPLANGGIQQVSLGMPFPFYGHVFDQILVHADGLVGFDRPVSNFEVPMGCQSVDARAFYALAPFRTELDLTRGGVVRTALLPALNAFVVSYEAIHARNGPMSATYSFQVVLYATGAIEYRYGSLAALPALVSVGLQRFAGDTFIVGCNATLPIHTGLTLRFRSQPDSSSWLRGATSGSLAVGQQHSVTMVATGIPPWQYPFRSRILIKNSDPRQPLVTVPIELRSQPDVSMVRLPVVFVP